MEKSEIKLFVSWKRFRGTSDVKPVNSPFKDRTVSWYVFSGKRDKSRTAYYSSREFPASKIVYIQIFHVLATFAHYEMFLHTIRINHMHEKLFIHGARQA